MTLVLLSVLTAPALSSLEPRHSQQMYCQLLTAEDGPADTGLCQPAHTLSQPAPSIRV